LYVDEAFLSASFGANKAIVSIKEDLTFKGIVILFLTSHLQSNGKEAPHFLQHQVTYFE
jgi:hypothetical protein